MRSAFTLIELMVVIGIISLLIALVLPSFNAAKRQARVTATRQMINVIETGVEQFRADQTVGGDYPPSLFQPMVSPHKALLNDGPVPVGGANLLAWALAGADLLGTPGFRDLNGNGMWHDNAYYQEIDSSKGQQATSLYAIDIANNTRRPAVPRSGPYVELTRMKFPQLRQVGNEWRFVIESRPQAGFLNSICFLDTFDQPILYYRASAGASKFVADEPFIERATGFYNYADNAIITGSASQDIASFDLGAGPAHPLTNPGTWDLSDPTKPPEPRGSFAFQLWNPDIRAVRRPHRPDSFILLSAGADGLYGTADDLANFPINK